MKRLLVFLTLIAALSRNVAATEWLTDLPTAMARARKENKAVLLDFCGSDWCGWCKSLRSEVLDTFEFGAYAAANLILVAVDFPRQKQLSTEHLNANYTLAAKYGVKGYPTVIVLNADGRTLGRCGYVEGGPVAFVRELERFPGMPHKGRYLVSTPANPTTPADPTAGSNTNWHVISVRPALPAVAPQAAAGPASPYGDLTLKGISGAGDRRLALINNEPMKVGESARVKSFGTNIEVTVQEIRNAAVIVVVGGRSRELTLGSAPAKP